MEDAIVLENLSGPIKIKNAFKNQIIVLNQEEAFVGVATKNTIYLLIFSAFLELIRGK